MPGETTRTPLTVWRRDVMRATVLAYRKAMGEGLTDWEAWPQTRTAYLAAGGDPDRAHIEISKMIAAAARDHGEWFWRPARLHADRRDRYMRSVGMWPPPPNWTKWPKPPDDFE